MRKYSVGQRLLSTVAFREKYGVANRTPCRVIEDDKVLDFYKVKVLTDEPFAPEHVLITVAMMEMYFELDSEQITVPAVLVGWYKTVERYIR